MESASRSSAGAAEHGSLAATPLRDGGDRAPFGRQIGRMPARHTDPARAAGPRRSAGPRHRRSAPRTRAAMHRVAAGRRDRRRRAPTAWCGAGRQTQLRRVRDGGRTLARASRRSPLPERREAARRARRRRPGVELDVQTVTSPVRPPRGRPRRERRGHQAGGAQPAGSRTSARRRSSRTNRRVTAASMPPECACAAGRRRANRAAAAAVDRAIIRTGSSAGPWAVRSPAAARSARRRCAPRTSRCRRRSRGSASFSGRSALDSRRTSAGRRPAAGRTSQPLGKPVLERRRRDEVHAPQPRRHGAERAEHRPRQLRLRRRDRGVGVAHGRPGDHAGLQHQVRAARRRTPAPTARGRPACPARPSRSRASRPCVTAGAIVYLAT